MLFKHLKLVLSSVAELLGGWAGLLERGEGVVVGKGGEEVNWKDEAGKRGEKRCNGGEEREPWEVEQSEEEES